MNGLFVSQVMSLEAPQMEVDKVAKGQQQAQISQATNEEAFMKVLNKSMKEVKALVHTEKNDQVLKDEDEDQDQENKER